MLHNKLLKKKKINSIYYNLKHKINKKYKKIQKFNKYLSIYNPRREININSSIMVHLNKIYIK